MTDMEDYSLRPMTANDRDDVREWRNREHVRSYMFETSLISEEDHNRWFDDTLARGDKDYQVVLYKNQPIGIANAVAINSDKRSCEWGFYLFDSDTPKGSGTCMGILMIEHIFDTLAVDTILAEVLEYNTASIRLHEKLGFQRDSDHDRVHKGGSQQHAVLAYRLNRQDWQQ